MKRNIRFWLVLTLLAFFAVFISSVAGFLLGGFLYRREMIEGLEPSFPMLSLLFTVLVLSLCMITYITVTILKPLNRLIDALKEVSRGKFSLRLSEDRGSDMIRDINKSFNSMQEELSSIETLRNDFVANVSHEFKTPLSAIEGYASLLLNDDISREEQQNYARRIMESTRQLSKLTGNILALSRLNTGPVAEKSTLFSLDEQLREAILTLEQQWTKKDIEISMENLPEISLRGYENLLFQVWTNLYSNAIKFSPDGGKIETRIERTAKGVFVSIRDEGIGMSEQQQKHIFEKFYQADTAHKAEGNGLGLALVHRIVEIHGGAVEVNSREGEGSCFTVFLPFRPQNS